MKKLLRMNGMIKAVFYVGVILLPGLLNAQVTTAESAKGKAKEYYERGNYDFGMGKLPMADSLLRMATLEKDNFIDAWRLLGQLNLEYMHQYKKAAEAFEKVKLLQKDYMRDIDFQLAKCYMNLGEYGAAKAHANDYLQTDKIPAQNNFAVHKILIDCDFASEAMKHPVEFKPKNLGPGVNTADDESMPTLTADQKYLYFTRHTGLGAYQDENIFMSINDGENFSPASPVPNINTEQYVEGAQSISPSGKYLFFTSGDRPDGEGRADIYMSRKTGDEWERANNIGTPVNTPGWDAQPCISADGRALYFASVRAGGIGGSDLYVSYLDDKTGWSKPENLGETINTQFDEMRPFIHPDGKTLFFSSDGHPGMGGMDIYMSQKQADGKWGKPVNLGYPINTPGDELGIYVTPGGSRAYYASEQKDTKGQKDIYVFDMPESIRPGFTSYVKGTVYDNQTREALPSVVQVYDVETGKLFATFSTDKINGTFLSTLPTGKNYAVEVQRDGYLFQSQNISLKDGTQQAPFEINIGLKKIKVGEAVVLNNIFFEPEKYNLKSESEAELAVVIKLLNKNPQLKIEIGGHTDNSGTEADNKKLSEERAKSVYDYLISKGIAADRLSYKGYAATKPVASNATAEGKARNRRTEFTVTGI